jgi:hypothetical protein
MNTHPQSSYLDSEDLRDLHGLFDSVWQELVRDVPVSPDKAEQLRQELAQSILSMRDLEPEVIRRTVVQNMRRSINDGPTQKR